MNWKDAVTQYKHDGYYIARGIVPVKEVERVFANMHYLFVQQLKQRGLPFSKGESVEAVHQDLKMLFAHDLKAYLATLTLCAKLVSLYDLYMHPNIRSLTQALGIAFPVFQTAPVMHLMSPGLKIEGGYYGIGAHQDWPTLQGGLDTLTIWIPLIDVDRNMYTLDVLPGSHMKGLLPYTREEHIFEVDPSHYDIKDFVPIEAELGDMLFMSSFMVHRSSKQGDDRLRVATSFRYENAAEPHFIARNYPFAQKRSVIRELITPDFPSLAQVRKLYES